MSDRPLPLRSPSSPPPISISRFPRLCSILVKSMARFRNSLLKWQAPVLIWTSSLVLFYFTFRIAMDQSAPASLDDGSTMSSSELRARLYDKMAKDLDDKGAAFLKGGETSQSLSLSDLFEVRDGSVTPRLKAADPLVRANVLYLSPEFSLPISKAVKEIFLPYFDGGQDGGCNTNTRESHQNYGEGDGVGLCDKPTASDDRSRHKMHSEVNHLC